MVPATALWKRIESHPTSAKVIFVFSGGLAGAAGALLEAGLALPEAAGALLLGVAEVLPEQPAINKTVIKRLRAAIVRLFINGFLLI
jgi:hypothetical protein